MKRTSVFSPIPFLAFARPCGPTWQALRKSTAILDVRRKRKQTTQNKPEKKRTTHENEKKLGVPSARQKNCEMFSSCTTQEGPGRWTLRVLFLAWSEIPQRQNRYRDCYSDAVHFQKNRVAHADSARAPTGMSVRRFDPLQALSTASHASDPGQKRGPARCITEHNWPVPSAANK